MSTFDDDRHEGAPLAGAPSPSRGEAPASGKTLRFALVFFCICLTCSVATALIMRYVGHSLGTVGTLNGPAAAARPTVATVAAPGRPSPSTPNAGAKVSNMLTYAADGTGHYFIDAAVNGAPVRFMVDTGATFVSLSPADAAAAGIVSQNLSFSEAMNTANGVTHAARTSLRSVRLGQLEIGDVTAVVMDQPMPFSLLGMSFLSRVDGYSIRDGVLTIEW